MKSSLKVVLGALVLAVAAAGLVYVNSANQNSGSPTPESNQVRVLVSSSVIKSGQSITDAQAINAITEKLIDSTSAPMDAITEITPNFADQIAIGDIPSGEILLKSQFMQKQSSLGPLVVPDGKLAVTVDLTDAAHVGNFLRPGSTIAIFSTVSSATGANALTPIKTTRLLLGNVLVLATGSSTTLEQADEAASADRTQILITVAVTQKQAEKLIHGVQTSALHFGLIGSGAKVTPGPGISDTDLFSGTG